MPPSEPPDEEREIALLGDAWGDISPGTLLTPSADLERLQTADTADLPIDTPVPDLDLVLVPGERLRQLRAVEVECAVLRLEIVELRARYEQIVAACAPVLRLLR